jgi:hypothetical protein
VIALISSLSAPLRIISVALVIDLLMISSVPVRYFHPPEPSQAMMMQRMLLASA